MARTAIGVAIGAAFVAAVIWSAFSATAFECEICVEFQGRKACSIARAVDLLHAEAQAQSGACAQVANGVTDTVACGRSGHTLRRCTE
jgi:hypothetical protein